MTYFNEPFVNNCYGLEFTASNNVSDFILFSLPPQNESFTFAQRVAETKTFGGSVFEDYGNDSVIIQLTGTTTNTERRIVYVGTTYTTKYQTFLTGEEEIAKIQNLIATYGKRKNLDRKQVRFYCLSNPGFKSFVGRINKFEIKRSKENPLSYTYTLEFIGSQETFSRMQISLDKAKTVEESISEKITKTRNILDFLKSGLSAYRTGLDYITAANNALDNYEKTYNQYVDTVNGYITSTAQYVNEGLALGDKTLTRVARVTLGVGLKVLQAVQEVNLAANKVYKYVRDFPENNIFSYMIEQYGKKANEIKEVWIEAANDGAITSASMKSNSIKNTTDVEYCVLPGNSDEDDEVVPIYGFETIKVTDSTTWDLLAKDFLNDASLSTLISVYNSETIGVTELIPGITVRIPILSPVQALNETNMVYEPSDNNTLYGTDIAINNGEFTVENGDIGVISGPDNLEQAINNRLQTSLDSRIRLGVYGIINAIGSSNIAESFVLSSIQETLLQEPRIQSIDKISFTGKGDKIYISIDYTDIHKTNRNFGGLF